MLGFCFHQSYNTRKIVCREAFKEGRRLAGSTSKKVVVRRFEREALTGFVNPGHYLLPEGIELLSQSGTISLLPYSEVKAVCFVRDFESSEGQPSQRLFHTRPKMEGLWVRMRFLDGELMDGLLPNNLLQLEPSGFTVVPPNPSSNNQRIFVPRSALRDFQVLGVVGSPLRRRKPKVVPKEQIEMFE
jgi:hypothetical protein